MRKVKNQIMFVLQSLKKPNQVSKKKIDRRKKRSDTRKDEIKKEVKRYMTYIKKHHEHY